MCPSGRQQRGRRIRGCDIFCDTKYTKKFRELCSGRDGHGSTNHVRRTMHILDVIGSVSRSSKCTKVVGGWGFAPDPTGGVYSASPDFIAGFNALTGPTSKGKERKGREAAKMIYAPSDRKLRSSTESFP